MNRVELLKLAYARGAFLALREAGYQEKVAEDLALKIADRDALDVLEDVGIGAGIGGLGGAALGAGGGALATKFMGPGARNLTMQGLPSAIENLPQRIQAGAVGGVPGATELAGLSSSNPVLQKILQSPNALRNLIRESAMAGNMNVGARAGGLTGASAGGLIGGLAGE